jgi:glycosyltransferase involved in cell wall biosynthesis
VRFLVTSRELPPPPQGKTGWPWTGEIKQFPSQMPDGKDWLKISLITPNYNYGHFLEETIRSILLQGYPNLEYIIIDGGSTDNSVEVIQKYEPWLTYWVSEPDKGQANAINKGLKKCTGEIFNWINSDDYMEPESLEKISIKFKNFDVLAGWVQNFSEEKISKSISSKTIFTNQKLSAVNLIASKTDFHQPGIWLRLDSIEQIGGFDETMDCCFDWDLIVKYVKHFPKVTYIDRVLVNFRLHSNAKTILGDRKFFQENTRTLMNLLQDDSYKELHPYIHRYMKTFVWYAELKKILASTALNRYQKIFRILQEACVEPKIRMSRFTFGAVRRLLLFRSKNFI